MGFYFSYLVFSKRVLFHQPNFCCQGYSIRRTGLSGNGYLQVSNAKDPTDDKPRSITICDQSEDNVTNYWIPLLDSVTRKNSTELCCGPYEGSLSVDKKQIVRTAMKLESDMIKRRRTGGNQESAPAAASSSFGRRPPVPTDGFGPVVSEKTGVKNFKSEKIIFSNTVH